MTIHYNPFSLKGKTILITGASSGIGKTTAIECSKMGALVVITGRDEDRLQETFGQLVGTGHQQYIADLSLENELNSLVSDLPVLDGIVHAAGMVKVLPFPFISSNELMVTFSINFFAPVLLSQKLIKSGKIIKGGSVVFMSSISGSVIASAGHSVYAASKGAVTAMVKGMAIDLAPKKIRVNSISPGMIETPLIHNDRITQGQLDEDKKHYPLKRYGKPEEIAFASIYLLSDASAWVTGTNLIIDGGFTLI